MSPTKLTQSLCSLNWGSRPLVCWLVGVRQNYGNRIAHQLKLFFFSPFRTQKKNCNAKHLTKIKEQKKKHMSRLHRWPRPLTLRPVTAAVIQRGRNEGQFSLDLVLTRNVSTCQNKKRAVLVMAGRSARDARCTLIPDANVNTVIIPRKTFSMKGRFAGCLFFQVKSQCFACDCHIFLLCLSVTWNHENMPVNLCLSLVSYFSRCYNFSS